MHCNCAACEKAKLAGDPLYEKIATGIHDARCTCSQCEEQLKRTLDRLTEYEPKSTSMSDLDALVKQKRKEKES